MSIEQTSVSNPVVRENEISSKRSAWSETQGSATGSKDGQLSSFWDKAFLGAQKLFGIEKAGRSDLSKNEESLREEEEYRDRADNRLDNRRLDTTPGFGNSGFSRISVSIRREGPPELPELAPVQRLGDKRTEMSNARDKWADQRVEDSRLENDARRDRIEDQDEDSDSYRAEAKTADLSSIAPQEIAKMASNTLGGDRQVVDRQSLKAEEGFVGINSAKLNLNMSTNLATNSLEESAVKGQSPIEAIEEVSLGGIRRLPSDGHDPVKPVFEGPEGGKGERGRNMTAEVRKASDSKTAAPSRHSALGRDANLISADSLTIDAEKAKQNISTLIDHSKAANSNKSGPMLSGGSLQSTQSVSTSNSAESLVEKEGGSDGEGKSVDNSKNTNPKSQAPQSARQEVVKPIISAANSVGTVRTEPSQSKKGEISLVGSVARISENALISNRPGIVNQGTPTGLGPVSAGLNASSGESQGLNPLRGPSEKVLAKQEVESPQKGNVLAKSSGTTAKGDGVQGIQLNGSDNSGSSKSSFAAKAQAVSYSTKSTEETKEIYTALSKSVDRLVSSKSDTVSLRINFDQGGSMALRVSMDSGQVNTSMQTDLPGLESLIKSSWSEFAHEQNQKGLKLNVPQFTTGDSENSKNEHFMSFDQKGGQSKGEASNESKTNGGRRSSAANRQQADTVSSDNAEDSSDDLKTEQEFKTYA